MCIIYFFTYKCCYFWWVKEDEREIEDKGGKNRTKIRFVFTFPSLSFTHTHALMYEEPPDYIKIEEPIRRSKNEGIKESWKILHRATENCKVINVQQHTMLHIIEVKTWNGKMNKNKLNWSEMTSSSGSVMFNFDFFCSHQNASLRC